MRVGIPKETWPGETRVAVIPAGAAALKKTGVDVAVEAGAGTAAGFPDEAYRQQVRPSTQPIGHFRRRRCARDGAGHAGRSASLGSRR